MWKVRISALNSCGRLRGTETSFAGTSMCQSLSKFAFDKSKAVQSARQAVSWGRDKASIADGVVLGTFLQGTSEALRAVDHMQVLCHSALEPKFAQKII